MALHWTAHDTLVVDGVKFKVGYPEAELAHASTDELVVLKPTWMIDRYVQLLAELRPTNIFELGIFRGGSTALLAMAAKPRRLVAIDLEDQTTPSFAEWLRGRRLEDRVYLHYGVDQSDGARLRSILDASFGTVPLDLVVDDASHLLDPTRASFDVLFPRLRAGGIYVIEDWDGQQQFGRAIQQRLDIDPAWREQWERQLRDQPERLVNIAPSLTMMITDLVLTTAYTDLIDDIRIRRGLLTVRRGPGDPGSCSPPVSQSHLRWRADLSEYQPE